MKAFGECSGIAKITIPNSVTSIGHYAFYSCEKVERIHFKNPNGWTALSIDGTKRLRFPKESLSNPSVATEWLVDKYFDINWERKDT